MPNFYAYEHGLPCRNPHCGSQGKPHPNCKCWSSTGEKHFAKGGEVNFCSSMNPHNPGCEYYADGGNIQTMNPMAAPALPAVTLGHAVISHGLLGLLKNVGRPNMADPDKHHKVLDKAKSHLAENDHESAANALHGSPLGGSASKENMKKIVERMGPPMMAHDSDPEALRGSVDYLNSSLKGHDSLSNHIGQLADNKTSIDPDENGVEGLKKYLEEVKENPERMLEIGGKLGHYLPDQAAGLGALAATATDYLNSIKPMSMHTNPLDDVSPPDQMSMDRWNRHLDIAQKPQRVLQYVKEGTLLPQDLLTVQTIYPGLYASMVQKAGEAIIDAKTKKKEIPYHQRQSLSLLLGQPLDSTMSPENMQAIIRSAGGQQAQNIMNKQKKSSQKTTAAELKQIDKVDKMYQTPIESRQLDRKS